MKFKSRLRDYLYFVAMPYDGTINDCALRLIRGDSLSHHDIKCIDAHWNRMSILCGVVVVLGTQAAFRLLPEITVTIAVASMLVFLILLNFVSRRSFAYIFRSGLTEREFVSSDIWPTRAMVERSKLLLHHECIRKYWDDNQIGTKGLATVDVDLMNRVDDFITQGRVRYPKLDVLS